MVKVQLAVFLVCDCCGSAMTSCGAGAEHNADLTEEDYTKAVTALVSAVHLIQNIGREVGGGLGVYCKGCRAKRAVA